MHLDQSRYSVHEDGVESTTPLDTRLIWAGLFFAVAIFAKVPGLDLLVSANYYNQEHGFFLADKPIVRALYDWTPRVGRGLLIMMAVYFVIAPWVSRWFAYRGRSDLARKSVGPWRRGAVLSLCCALLAPGLFVDVVLKDTIGRPRPIHVEQFGGEHVYLAPFDIGEDPKTHRSFVSGHAAAGFALMSLGLTCGPVWRRRWLLIGAVTGGIIGLGRMMQGGHFLSDVIFAFYTVWLSCELVAWVDRRLQQRRRRRIT